MQKIRARAEELSASDEMLVAPTMLGKLRMLIESIMNENSHAANGQHIGSGADVQTNILPDDVNLPRGHGTGSQTREMDRLQRAGAGMPGGTILQSDATRIFSNGPQEPAAPQPAQPNLVEYGAMISRAVHILGNHHLDDVVRCAPLCTPDSNLLVNCIRICLKFHCEVRKSNILPIRELLVSQEFAHMSNEQLMNVIDSFIRGPGQKIARSSSRSQDGHEIYALVESVGEMQIQPLNLGMTPTKYAVECLCFTDDAQEAKQVFEASIHGSTMKVKDLAYTVKSTKQYQLESPMSLVYLSKLFSMLPIDVSDDDDDNDSLAGG